MNGNVVVKSFSGFQVNEGLVLKVVEAIKKGEADARRYSQIRSFEIYYEGFRQRMVLGRIMIIPAKLADSVEDFPAALMYGAMVREIHPEEQADIYTYRLGESEFDVYDASGLRTIKDKLFKDSEGKYRSVIMFIPTWANVRDYVILKFTRNDEILRLMVRHQIYGAYYNPAFSSAFDNMSNDTDNLDVSDITPKINYPGLAEGQIQSFPELVAGDGGIKTASTPKPRMLLAADTVNDINEEFLEPGERAVIDSLAEDLKGKITGEEETPSEVAKEAGKGTPDVNHPRFAVGNAFLAVQKFQLSGEQDPSLVTKAINLLNSIEPTLYTPGQENGVSSAIKHLDEYMTYEGGGDENLARAYTDLEDLCVDMSIKIPGGSLRSASKDDAGATTGLRDKPDYGESDSHTSEANALAAKGASAKRVVASGKVAAEEWAIWEDGAAAYWKVVNKGLLGKEKVLGQGQAVDKATATEELKAFLEERKSQFVPQVPRGALASLAVVACEGASLVRTGTSFILKAASGHTEPLRINANKVKWQRPLQFTLAFRAAVENFVRNPRSGANKTADVPLTFDSIWADIAKDMGPAPVVNVKEQPAKENRAPQTEAPGKNNEDKSEERPAPERNKAESKPKEDDTPKEEKTEKPEKGVNPFAKKDDKPESKEAAFESLIPSQVLAAHYPDLSAKLAAFDMFIPGQVLKEFDPDLLHDTVEYPTEPSGGGNGYDPGIGLPGGSPSGVQQSADGLPADGDPYVSTDPTAAMGLGRDGKPQILEGAPLRTEQDIRGYQFDQEFYAASEGLSSKAFRASYAIATINKKASVEEFRAQFADFLKKAMGEIAATFIAAFKVTSRPLMNKVPGTGQIKLDEVENAATFVNGTPLNVSSRVAYLMSKLTDSDIKEAINSAWSQAAVWNEDTNGGYTYEVFVRPEALDKQTMVLSYNFVVGTKGL
jgi:hypothetical protein